MNRKTKNRLVECLFQHTGIQYFGAIDLMSSSCTVESLKQQLKVAFTTHNHIVLARADNDVYYEVRSAEEIAALEEETHHVDIVAVPMSFWLTFLEKALGPNAVMYANSKKK